MKQTAKQKANELINAMYPQTDVPKYENAIKCAIIAVEEIITELKSHKIIKHLRVIYWIQVLTELKSRQ